MAMTSRLQGRTVIVGGEEPCSYCGRALDNAYGGSEGHERTGTRTVRQ